MKKIIIYTLLTISLLFVITVSVLVYSVIKITDTKVLTSSVNYTNSICYTKSGHILVDVFINNDSTPYPFILDNGATTIIFNNLNDKLKFEKVAYMPTRDINKNYSITPVYKIGRIELESGIIAVDVTSKMFSPDFLKCEPNVYGIIGRDIINKFVWQFDFEKNTYSVVTESKNIIISNHSFEIPLIKHKSQYYISTIINNAIKQELSVDLGSTSSIKFEMKQDSIEYHFKNKYKTIFGRHNAGLNGNNNDVNANSVLIDKISFGNYIVTNIEASVVNKTLNVIGLDFFKNYNVVFDFPKNKLFLTQNSETEFTFEHFGVGVSYNDVDCKIDYLVNGSLPYLKGIRMDDKVFKINGEIYDKHFDRCKNIYQNDTLYLTISKTGKLIEYAIPKHYYF